MNIILIVIIVVVIYLIYTSSSSKNETFGVNPSDDGYTNNSYWDHNRTQCNDVNTIDDCQNPYHRSVCSDKCDLIRRKSDKNQKNSELINY
jgi:hypothetical protein